MIFKIVFSDVFDLINGYIKKMDNSLIIHRVLLTNILILYTINQIVLLQVYLLTLTPN